MKGRATDADDGPKGFKKVWLTPHYLHQVENITQGDPGASTRIAKTIRYYYAAPDALQRKPVRGARSRVYESRVDREKRVIDEDITKEYPSEAALVHVGHHDAALRFAQSYPGGAVAEIRRRHAKLADPASNANGGSQVCQANPKTYGDYLTRDEVVARGVPIHKVEKVRQAPANCPVERLGVDAETADKVENWYLAKLPAPPIPVPIPALTQPVAIPVTSEEVPALLRVPLRRFLAMMTEEQRVLATRRSTRLYVVKGAAGSGKTIVGIRRVEHLLSQGQLLDGRPILFTCFNRVLAHAARQMLTDTLGSQPEARGVEVQTVYQLMWRLLREPRSSRLPELLGADELVRFIGPARRGVGKGTALVKWSDRAILDEILEVIYGRVIVNVEQYLAADRRGRGRGRALDTLSRRILWVVYEGFRKQCQAERVEPWEWIPARLALLLEKSPPKTPRFAAIVVDEAQDLVPSVFRVLVALQAGRDDNILVLGDAAQNVYRNGFRWAHTGLKVAGGQVTILKRCFRSTRHIVAAATPLVSKQLDRLEDDLVLADPATDNPGPKPIITIYANRRSELESVAVEIGVHIEHGIAPSLIGVLLDDTADRRELAFMLRSLGIQAEDHIKKGGVKSIDIFHPSVKMLTTGSAKGIEFQVLFVPGVTESRFPASDEDGEAADRARRALYTAMMRSAWSLNLSAVQGVESRLLNEVDPKHVDARTMPSITAGGYAPSH